MTRYPALVLLGVLWLLAGCKKESKGGGIVLTGTDAFSQILRDFEMRDIVNGTKNMVVESIEGRLHDLEHVADVDKPKVTFFKEGEPSSVLVAPQGRVHMDTHEVQAWGGVTVVTVDSVTLTTERLRYDPVKQRLISDDAVRLEKPDSITEGVGLDADPDLSRVRIGHEKVYVKSH